MSLETTAPGGGIASGITGSVEAISSTADNTVGALVSGIMGTGPGAMVVRASLVGAAVGGAAGGIARFALGKKDLQNSRADVGGFLTTLEQTLGVSAQVVASAAAGALVGGGTRMFQMGGSAGWATVAGLTATVVPYAMGL